MATGGINPGHPLAEMGLPADYGSLTTDGRREARMAALTAWSDPTQPNVFCTDTDAWVRAVKLFRTYYIMPADCNAAVYDMRDPTYKWDLVRFIMSPPMVESEPTKCVVRATRHGTKTHTVIHECALMAGIVRPHSEITISEFNQKRTREEMSKLRDQIVKNDLIHEDFGGAGKLWSRRRDGVHKWNDDQLDLLNGSKFLGISQGAAARGRHPHWIIIDDPEKDEQTSANPEWRRKYFSWLFRVMLGQVRRGHVVTWIGTPVCEFACLSLALRGKTDSPDDEGYDPRDHDERFDDWLKAAFDLIEYDDKGAAHSTFEDYLSADEFEAKAKAVGHAAAMAEFQGDPRFVDGVRVLTRSESRHGYMHCVRNEDTPNEEFYMLDLKTGEQKPWEEWLQTLEVVAANDIGDSISPSSDQAASVFLGVDPYNVIYVLDVWARRALVDDHVPKAFELADKWRCGRMGWEKAGLQTIVCRWTDAITKQRRSDGLPTPAHVGIENFSGTGRKVPRIIAALSQVLTHDRIRFLYFNEFEAADGVTHKPAKNEHRVYHQELKMVIDTFTDQGPSGFIDSADALEMALRLAKGARGAEQVKVNPNERSLSEWEKLGVQFNPSAIPLGYWTREMREQQEALQQLERRGKTRELNPYAV